MYSSEGAPVCTHQEWGRGRCSRGAEGPVWQGTPARMVAFEVRGLSVAQSEEEDGVSCQCGVRAAGLLGSSTLDTVTVAKR